MRKLFPLVVLLMLAASLKAQTQAPLAGAQTKIVRFYSSESTVDSARLYLAVQKHCENATLTIDKSKTDYVIRAEFDSNDFVDRNRETSLTLYNKDGDAVFASRTKISENAVKDACAFLKIEKQ
jgi:hypothetical protein